MRFDMRWLFLVVVMLGAQATHCPFDVNVEKIVKEQIILATMSHTIACVRVLPEEKRAQVFDLNMRALRELCDAEVARVPGLFGPILRLLDQMRAARAEGTLFNLALMAEMLDEIKVYTHGLCVMPEEEALLPADVRTRVQAFYARTLDASTGVACFQGVEDFEYASRLFVQVMRLLVLEAMIFCPEESRMERVQEPGNRFVARIDQLIEALNVIMVGFYKSCLDPVTEGYTARFDKMEVVLSSARIAKDGLKRVSLKLNSYVPAEWSKEDRATACWGFVPEFQPESELGSVSEDRGAGSGSVFGEEPAAHSMLVRRGDSSLIVFDERAPYSPDYVESFVEFSFSQLPTLVPIARKVLSKSKKLALSCMACPEVMIADEMGVVGVQPQLPFLCSELQSLVEKSMACPAELSLDEIASVAQAQMSLFGELQRRCSADEYLGTLALFDLDSSLTDEFRVKTSSFYVAHYLFTQLISVAIAVCKNANPGACHDEAVKKIMRDVFTHECVYERQIKEKLEDDFLNLRMLFIRQLRSDLFA